MNLIDRFTDNDRRLRTIFTIALPVAIAMYFFCPEVMFVDTISFNETRRMLFAGEGIDHFRTPLYPLIMGLTHWPIATIALQTLVFMVSVKYFYRLLSMLTPRRDLVFAFSLIYVVHPSILFYNYQLLSESLSISGSVFYLYLLVGFIKTEKTSRCWAAQAIALALILLKPAFIFLPAIGGIVLLWLIVRKKFNRQLVAIATTLLIQVAALSGYAGYIHHRYGVFAISSVTDINLYWMLEEYGLMDFSTMPDEHCKTYEDCLDRLRYLLKEYGWKDVHDIVNINIKANMREFLIGQRATELRAWNCFFPVTVFSGKSYWKLINNSLGMTFYQLFVIICLYFIFIVKKWHKKRKFPLISFLIFSIIMSNVLILYLTAMNDYSRLTIPALVAILLMLMQLLEWLISTIEARFIARRQSE
jgi:hypothetical protein